MMLPAQQRSVTLPAWGAQAAGTRPMMVGSPSSYPGYRVPNPQCETQCEDDCVEEECDADQCGNEDRAPRPDQLTCGIDHRPLLPTLLLVSTVVGAICMFSVQIPVLAYLMDVPKSIVVVPFMVHYLATFGLMGYSAFCEPGQLNPQEALEQGFSGDLLPRRCHKAWQYERAIRRYDHYCRWLMNCIGLLNHREFVAGLACLVSVGVVGIVLDTILAAIIPNTAYWEYELFILPHLFYCLSLTGLAAPILRIHFGLVSRNELAHEWKRNEFYVVRRSKLGDEVPVNELSDNEFNDYFDSFIYDRSRNKFDQGVATNCWNFWFTPRWNADEMGEF